MTQTGSTTTWKAREAPWMGKRVAVSSQDRALSDGLQVLSDLHQ